MVGHLADALLRDPVWQQYTGRELQNIRQSLDLSPEKVASLAKLESYRTVETVEQLYGKTLVVIKNGQKGGVLEETIEHRDAIARALYAYILTRPRMRSL